MIAREIMTTEVYSIPAHSSIGDALRILRKHTISGLPVVDEAGRPIGVITGGDVLRAFQERAQKIYYSLFGPTHVSIDESVWTTDRDQLLRQPVQKMMSRGLVTVSPLTPVGEIADLMLSQNVRRVFVVDQGRMVGVLTRNDIVRWLVREVDVTPSATR